ncbi:unnamed protein product [Brassica rapa subsp. trilocularis]
MENGPDDAVDIFHTYFGVAAKENLMIQNWCRAGVSWSQTKLILPMLCLSMSSTGFF